MSRHVNLIAYNQVEELQNFNDESFRSYCSAKLASCDPYVRFLRKYCVSVAPSWQGKICEIGSGNSKLLYRLEQAGLLREGIGYEISASRHRFAEKFREWVHSEHVININDNILNAAHLQQYDLIIGVDLVFQLIAPVAPHAEASLVQWITQSLREDGFLFLQLMDFRHILEMIRLQNGVYHWWERFPEYDPWELVLVQFSLNDQKDIIWNKTFIKRNSTERSHFINVLRNYTPETMLSILAKAGFTGRVFSGDNCDIPLEQGEYVILAKKQSSTAKA
jgi:hypothetical protein